jgi:DNA-binding Lrp family transcriptional regulator
MVVLKLCTYEHKRPPMSMIAADLNMSPSEIHAAIKRLQQARLLHGPEMQEKPNLSALDGEATKIHSRVHYSTSTGDHALCSNSFD